MQNKAILKLGRDINVVVPDSLDLISHYVLREQCDWFEDEIKFVRLLLESGQKCIDIGANYGLFSLSMAQSVGPTGKVWSFEPATTTAAFLAESININGYTHVTLDRRGVSDREGAARLSLNKNSELNEIVREENSTAPCETISLVSLDVARNEHAWDDIDFIKIDAEGEEAAIIRGGRTFFQDQSPLIQYEVKAGADVHLELVNLFHEIGYASYRLVPGLDILVPFDPQGLVDGYLLNLFCCKPDRARRLAELGRLVQPEDIASLPQARDLLRRLNADDAYGWRNVLGTHPYGIRLTPRWRNSTDKGLESEIAQAISLHAIAHDQTLCARDRFAGLTACIEGLISVCNQQAGFLRTLSLARVAREFGARAMAVQALNILVNQIMSSNQVNAAEPFLAASRYFDAIDPREAVGEWVLCSALEELERNSAYSSFYTGLSAIDRLLAIEKLGFGSPEMARRLDLVRQRFASQSAQHQP